MPTMWVSRGDDGRLVALEQQGYAAERDFQRLLADNPSVLASSLDESGTEARWLLIDRELSIVGDDGTRWSLDHLFIDGDGVATLVEVKRSGDSRARREVVAQMLDYVSSFEATWTADGLREHLRRRAGEVAELESFLAQTDFESEDHFWKAVETTIAASRVRLLFVADQLSPTLVKIIEFLNDQFRTVEVLGVEVVRHAELAGDVSAYQPVVRGRASRAARDKSPSGRRTREEFIEVLVQNHGEAVRRAVDEFVQRAEQLGAFLSVGTDPKSPRLFLNFHTAGTGKQYWPIAINPRPGKVALFLQYLRHHPAFADEEVRLELVSRMSEAAGTQIDTGKLDGRPGFPVGRLAAPGIVDACIDVLAWVIATADAQPE